MFMNRLVMQIISADILSIDSGIITHQVNCRGVMGAGLAKALRKRYPAIFPEYRKLCINGQLRPGMIQLICVADGLYIATAKAVRTLGVGHAP
jgi:O-acetyl-ADP-ribose deacetylase (regulator of RNase III)